MHSISQRIRYYRKKRGLTQMDVATALAIRTDNYSKYESGARVPRDDRLIAMAKILGVSYDALNEGIERGFADMLKSHAIGSVVGNAGSFSAFLLDMETTEAYCVVSDFFDRGAHDFASDNASFYQKYLDEPDLAGLIELYEIYREQCDSDPAPEQIDGVSLNVSYLLNELDAVTSTKWAFCIAVKRYLERNDAASILDATEELAGNLLETISALQFFAAKVFVPYLALIIDAVDLCMNTTIDDFGISFLFCALTPPDDDNEDDDDE